MNRELNREVDPVWDGAHVRLVADRLLAPVAVITADGTLLYVNAAASRALGEEPGRLIGHKMLTFVHPDDRVRVGRELRNVAAGRLGGSTTFRIRIDARLPWRVFETIVDNLLDDPTIEGILMSIRDVTDQLAVQRELHDAAFVDPLTSLPNRAGVTAQLEGLMEAAAGIAVAFVDIDRFSLINESLGHSSGDAVLQAVAGRIRSCLPPATVVGRFSTDMFVLLVTEATAQEARALAWRTIERVGEPLFIAGHELRLALSVGMVQRDPAATSESLLRDAGLALRRARAGGGGRVESFAIEMRDEAIGRLELEANLRRAISRSEFRLALQPIVRIDDATPVRSEALVRWNCAGVELEPQQFIPVAEETGLIVPLGDWIIDRAAQLAPRAPGAQVMVNLSAKQLASPGLPERIARVLAARRTPSSMIGFEVTETLVIEHFDFAVQVLSAIRQLGCKVGLDDFGTGYSSLSYLRRLPIDFLKIDGSLTADVDTDHQARAIVGAIITMADALALDVVAEGVETEAQASTLGELGCKLAQGFFYGRPISPVSRVRGGGGMAGRRRGPNPSPRKS